MKKKFVTNLILLLALNLLIKPFWIFGIDRTVQNIVGAESYGAYFALLNISFLFNIFLDLGITNFNNRNIAQNNHLLNKHFSGIVVMKLFLSIVYLAITLIYVFLFSYSKAQIFVLMVLCVNQFLASFTLYLRSNISGIYMFRTDSFLSVLDRLLMIIICSVLLWSNITRSQFKIEWFIYSQTAAYLITFFIAFTIVVKKAAFKKIRWNLLFFVVIFKQSFPFALLVLLMSFYYRIDSIMLERMLKNGAEQAGIYAAAFRLLDAGYMLANLFAVLLLPIFSKMIKEKEKIDEMFKLSFSLIIVPAIIIAVCCFFYNFNIMGVLYHENVEGSAKVFRVLMMCFVAISGSYIFSTLLTASGKLKYLNLIALLGMFINISLNYFLIPHFESLGSAYASLITQFTVWFLQIAITVFIFDLKVNYKYIGTLLFFIIVVILLNIFSKSIAINWLIKISFTVIISFIFAFLFKIINLKDLYRIIFRSPSVSIK